VDVAALCVQVAHGIMACIHNCQDVLLDCMYCLLIESFMSVAGKAL